MMGRVSDPLRLRGSPPHEGESRRSEAKAAGGRSQKTFQTWLKFNAVGIVGIVVQLLALTLFKSGFNLNYLLATFLAVETAVLHNFFWHERWTWIERTRHNSHGVAGRLLRFHLANGLISIAGNLGLMWLFVSKLHVHYFLANLLAIGTCAIVNFLASDRLVFRREHPGGISR